MNVFWNRAEGRLRAMWRLILQAGIMVALAAVPILLIAEPLTALYRRGLFLTGYHKESYDRVINIVVGPCLAVAVLGSMGIAGRYLDRRRFQDFGGRMDRAWWRDLVMGLVLGSVLMGLIFAIQLAAGWVKITGFLVLNVPEVSLRLALTFSAVKVLCVGVYEEFLSRGYHLRNIAEATNLPTAIVASAAVFALLHALNENATMMSAAGLFINGLLFSVAAVVTGRLSMSIGLHFSWNLFEGAIFGFPVSGDKEGASLVAIHQLGTAAMTGGDFGPEGGLLGMATSLLGAVLIFIRGKSVATRQRPS